MRRSAYREQGWRFSRVSVQDSNDREDLSPGATQLYAFMLMEDIHNGVLPYGPRPLGPRARIEPDDPELAAVIAQAISTDGSDRLQFALPEFIRQCASEIAVFGQAVREIGYWSAPDAKRPGAFRLLHLPPNRVLWQRGKPVQRLSDKTAASRGSRYVELPAADLLRFHWPHEKYGRHSDIMQRVRLLSGTSHPEFLIPDPRRDGGVVPVDFSDFHQTLYRALAEATRSVGWNARGLISKHQTDYHHLQRQLRFERFKIVLRSVIVDTLNLGLCRAGDRIGFTAHLSLDGAPDEAEVDEAERRLAEGKHTYKEIMAPFWRI